jgi:hypothetical protein
LPSTPNRWAPSVVDGFLHRVFEAANGILHFTGDLLRLAFGLDVCFTAKRWGNRPAGV